MMKPNWWIACALGTLIFLVTLVLVAPGWSMPDQDISRSTVPTPTPTLTPRGYLPVVLRNYSDKPLMSAGNQVYLQTIASEHPAAFQRESPNCRYGVAAWGANQLKWLPALGVGWYLDFSAHIPNGPENIEFVQMVRVRQNKYDCTYLPGYSVSPPLTEDGLGNLVRANPGALWLIGNEPDRGPNPGSDCTNRVQDDTYPEVYAEAYHEVYHFIKQRDPAAQVGIAALVEVTPGRLQYLDKVWQTYLQKYHMPMPVDVWNMHLYILPEVEWDGRPNGIANVALGTDPGLGIRNGCCDRRNCLDPRDNIYCYSEHDNLTIFADQIVRMRQWMKNHGEQNKPLIISEYSILYPFEKYDDPINPTRCFLQDEFGKCFTPVRVSHFMTRTFNYLETAIDPNLGYPLDNYRLVQQWLWFSMYYPGAGMVSSLVNSDATSLTLVGLTFSNTVNSLATYVNLFPAEVAYPVAFTIEPTGTVSVTLSASIYNNGNTYAVGPVTVTFYADQALTDAIGSYVFTGTLGGCARRKFTAAVAWNGLSPGVHRYWVKLEGDTYMVDNVATGYVLINPRQVFLPVVLRNR